MKSLLSLLITVFLTLTVIFANAQLPVYQLNLQNLKDEIRIGHLKAYGKSPEGTTFTVNSRYFEKDQKAWFPVMGEFHYIRYPAEYWEEEIVKMKSAGISIIATYIFWNAHETSQGTWNWSGNRNLRQFTELCRKHGLYVWLRIGPWSHGEQLYGGFPAWIQQMRGKRTNDETYLSEVRKLFSQIGEQTRDLFINSSGPIVGVQLENEFASGNPAHIKTLKQIAIASGMDPAYFTVTANTVFYNEEFEVIPLQGAYPYRGWEKGGGTATRDFLYANDQWIMTADLGRVYYDVDSYPRGLCEQGCGSQMTFSNRFIVDPQVVEAHLNNQVGRGMNLIGYYMFHGGTQMKGLEEPGLPLSYDFQAPVTEFGLLRPSYHYLKILHHFINDFGSDIARTQVIRPDHPVINPLNTDSLRYTGRFLGDEGFVFLCNTQVRVKMPEKKFRLNLYFNHDTLQMPLKAATLNGETTAILPINLNLAGCNIKYATAQPLSRISYQDKQYLFLYQVDGLLPEIALSKDDLADVDAEGWIQSESDGILYLTPENDSPGTIGLTSSGGRKSAIVVLSRRQAENSWRTRVNGQEIMIISQADVLFYTDHFEFRQLDDPGFKFEIFPPVTGKVFLNKQAVSPVQKGIFQSYSGTAGPAGHSLSVRISNEQAVVSDLPESLPDNLSDLFLSIGYLGSKANMTVNSEVVADHLFNGTPWMIGLKRYIGKMGNTALNLESEKWSDRITGLENPAIEKIKKNPGFTTITVHPQYAVMVRIGE